MLMDDIAEQRRRHRGTLLVAGACGAGAACASAALLGLSGWFITGAALAGLGGSVAAFNYLLPSAAIRFLAIARTAGRYGERLEGHRAVLFALAALRPRIFERLTRLPPTLALSLSAGEGAARMVDDVEAVETLFIRGPAQWAAWSGAAFGVLGVALADWRCAPVLGLSFCATVAASAAVGRRASRRHGAALQQAVGRLKDAAAATLAARAELAAYDVADAAARRIAMDARPVDQEKLAFLRAEGMQAAIGAIGGGVATVAVLFFARHAPLPMMAMAGLVAAATMEGAAGLGRGALQAASARAAAERIDGLAGTIFAAAPPPLEIGGRTPIHLAGGERLAIVGPSGCGKTSLIEATLGLRDGDATGLVLAGVPTGGDRRSAFAYAPQQPTLLAGTVRENLRLADPEAGEEALGSALYDAALDERVRRLPQGLDTWIGDGGERLSGGERRRLSLARALLRKAPWLVLDEPTEGLDAEGEARVVERLEARLARTGQGLILVSHRKAPLRLAHRVLDLSAASPATDAAA